MKIQLVIENKKQYLDLLLIADEQTCELKNIATDLRCQRKGYGTTLIEFLFEQYKDKYRAMLVGTSECPAIITFTKNSVFVVCTGRRFSRFLS